VRRRAAATRGERQGRWLSGTPVRTPGGRSKLPAPSPHPRIHPDPPPVRLAPVIIAALAALASAVPATAQSPAPPLVLRMPTGTRALAMGDAAVAVTDAEAVFHNPAQLTNGRGIALGAQRYGGGASLATMAVALTAAPGGLGIGVQHLSYHAACADCGGVATTESGLARRAAFTASATVATVGFGRDVDGVRVGVAGKVVEQQLPGVRAAAAAVDVGVARQVGPVMLAVAAQNLGGALRLGPAGTWELPRRATAGASVDFVPLGPFDLAASAAVAFHDDGEVVPGGGLELAYTPLEGYTIAGRVGLRRVVGDDVGPVSLGAMLARDRLALEYAYQPLDAAGDLHRLGVRVRP